MNIITLTKFGRTLLLTAVLALSAVAWLGCGDGGNPGGGGGTATGGNNTCGKDGTAGACKSVPIGGKTWMAENLNRATDSSWCYDNKESNCDKYGRLYMHSAALTACPTGWRLPTRDEWDGLGEAVGGEKFFHFESFDSIEIHDWENAGIKLRSKTGWSSDYPAGTDSYGFSALPGGSGDVTSTLSLFGGIGQGSIWWADGEYTGKYRDKAWVFSIRDGSVLRGYNGYKSYVISVRCVMD